MAHINEDKINEIRKNVDIVEVISKYIPLTKKGKNYFGICPFHDDTDPSLSVSHEKQIFKCFSCGTSGNVFTFLMDYEKITFLESVKKISEIAGISFDFKVKEVPNNFKKFFEIYQTTQKFFRNNLVTKYGDEAKKYLKNRQISNEIIDVFELGLATNQGSLAKYLLAKEYAKTDLIKLGLITQNETDIFYNRIMFPIHDTKGEIIGYSGRIFQADDQPKYINSPETPIFKKGEVLFNYHRAKEASRLEKQTIVLEGFMDVISLYNHEIKNTIATMGTAMTIEQARLIKKLSNDVILLFDGDDAGQRATLAAIDELQKVGIVPKVVRLDNNLDPDEYIIKNGINNFKKLLEKAENAIDFKLIFYKKQYNLSDSADLAKYVDVAINEISKINDDIFKEVVLKKLSDEVSIDVSFLKERLSNKKPVIKQKEVKVFENKYSLAQKYLLFYMLKSKEVNKIYRRRIKYMPTYEYRLLAIEISEYIEKNGDINMADIFTIVSHNEKITDALKTILSLNLKEEYKIAEIEDYVGVINEFNKNHQKERLKEEIKQTNDPNEKTKIAEKIRLLRVEEE